MRPAELAHGAVGCGTNGLGLRTHDVVLAVGFVPHRDHGDATALGQTAGFELRLGLVGKTIAHAERILAEFEGGAGFHVRANWNIALPSFRWRFEDRNGSFNIAKGSGPPEPSDIWMSDNLKCSW